MHECLRRNTVLPPTEHQNRPSDARLQLGPRFDILLLNSLARLNDERANVANLCRAPRLANCKRCVIPVCSDISEFREAQSQKCL